MSARMDLDNRFPAVPVFRARWTPVYLEPIQGSGERLTVAIVVTTGERAEIRPVVRPDVLKAIFGAKAKGIRGIVELAVDSLSGYLKASGSIAGWRSPISGIHLGQDREAASDDVEGIIRQAIQSAASLSVLDPLSQDSSDDEESQIQVANRKWADQIRDEIGKRRLELLPYFNRPGKFFENGEPVRFGFLGQGLVAQFGVLRPASIQPSVRDARARLWELSRARRLAEVRNVGLILYVPTMPAESPDTMVRNANELTLEAEEGKVGLYRVESTAAGADQIMRLAA